jgi:hypothetical protein
LAAGYLQLQPIEGLRIKGTISAQQTTITNSGWRDFDNWWFGENPENPFSSVKVKIAGTKPNLISRGSSVVTNMTKSFNIDYAKSFGDHNVNVTADASQQEYKWTTSGANSSILTNDPTLRYFSPDPNSSGFSESRGSWALIGYFARLNYNYSGKYYFDAVIRRDGSSRFAPGRQWGYFPICLCRMAYLPGKIYGRDKFS